MWRKPSEAASPDLAGKDPYAAQVPIARAIPFWGAISAKGYCNVLFHRSKKLSTSEWVQDGLTAGRLLEAVRQLRSTSRGPFRILCDNETFLNTKEAKAYYDKKNIVLFQIPPKSPDLNPIENYWSWVRKQMRAKDLADLRAGRPALGKGASKTRVKALPKTKGRSDWPETLSRCCEKSVLRSSRRRGQPFDREYLKCEQTCADTLFFGMRDR